MFIMILSTIVAFIVKFYHLTLLKSIYYSLRKYRYLTYFLGAEIL